MWLLATEFDNKPIYPPPFSILEIVVRVGHWLIFKRASKNTDLRSEVIIIQKHSNLVTLKFLVLTLPRRQRDHLRIFEKECLNEYLHLVKESEMKDINTRAQYIQEKYDGY